MDGGAHEPGGGHGRGSPGNGDREHEALPAARRAQPGKSGEGQRRDALGWPKGDSATAYSLPVGAAAGYRALGANECQRAVGSPLECRVRASFSRGDTVRVVALPSSVRALPPEIAAVFSTLVGRTLRVDEVDEETGCLALNVHADGSQAVDWFQHTVWLDPECAILVAAPAADDCGAANQPASDQSDDVVYAVETALQPDEFVDLLVRSTLAERRPVHDAATIAGMLANATIVVTARVGGSLVGVSRALSDLSYCTYLSDLAVDAAYQRRGIGRELIRRTHDAAGRHTTLVLLAAPKAREYYPHIGMRRHDSCWVVDRIPGSHDSVVQPDDARDQE